METIRNQINPQSVPLKFGRSSYDAVAFRNSSALFRRCCLLACPEFTVDERNRDFMNELFLYLIKGSEKLDSNKGLLLYGPVGTGKSTILKIVQLYDRYSNGKDETGYYLSGGFPIESATFISNQYTRKGVDGISKYDGLNGIALGIDEVGKEPRVKYFGSEMNIIQYILQSRYDNRRICKTFMTTNMQPEEFEPKYGEYIAARINEMFNVIEIKGKSRR